MEESKKENKKWYKTWWGILILICLLPITLSYIVWKRNWDIKLKVVIIGIIWVIYLALVFSSNYQKKTAFNEGYKAGLEEAKKSQSESPKVIISPSPAVVTSQDSVVEPSPISSPAPERKEISYKIADTWTSNFGQETWKALIVPEDITINELLDLVKKIHQQDPGSYYEIFDNTEELPAYIKWSESDNDPEVYFPEDWDMDHHVGMINQMLTREGMKWQFTSDKEKFLGSFDLD